MIFSLPTQKELAEIIRGYLAENRLMTMATCSQDAVPWASTALFAFDGNFTFYFLSEQTTRHVKNILETGRVAVAINQSRIEAGKIQGVQLEGVCRIVPEGEELATAYAVMAERHHWVREYVSGKDKDAPCSSQGASLSTAQYMAGNANRIFKITPQKILYIDDTRFPKATRVELFIKS